MAKKIKIRIGDTVKVITGSDKGTVAEVIDIKKTLPFQVKVRGVRLQTHFDKEKSQTFEKEGFVDYSNVALVKKKEKTTQEKKKPS